MFIDHFLKTWYGLVWNVYLPKMNHSTMHSLVFYMLGGLVM
jgi:hypothetical protein